MSRSFALRLLESFFRRWLLCLLPLLLFVSLGVLTALGSSDTYESRGVLYVENETLLSRLTAVDPSAGSGFQTPAAAAAQRLNDLMQTDVFFDSVLTRAGLTEFAASGWLTRDQLRLSVSVYAQGVNTVRAVGTSDDPMIAFRLADATLSGFVEWVIDTNLRDSATAEAFLNSQAETYAKDLETARSNLTTYAAGLPDVPVAQRSLAQTIEIDRRTAEVEAAEARYNSTIEKAEDARLAAAQTRSDVEGRFRLLDQPELPDAPTSSLMAVILRVALFTIMGLIISVSVVFLGALVDHTLRQPSEVTERLGVPLIAVLPESAGRSQRLGPLERR